MKQEREGKMKNKKKLWRIKKTKKEKELSTKEIKGEKFKNIS